MKKNKWKIILLINIALILLYAILTHYYQDNYDYSFLFFPLSFHSMLGIVATVINIITLFAMWFGRIKAEKLVKFFSAVIAICIFCLMISFKYSFELLVISIILLLLSSYCLIFQIIALAVETKKYGYIGFVVVPIIVCWMIHANILAMM